MHVVLLHMGDRFDLVFIYGGLLGVLLLIVGTRYISKRIRLYQQSRKEKKEAMLRQQEGHNDTSLFKGLLPE
ncbi:MAG: hypothetical protein JST82_05245 [Bacteroidetes bacterium]|nr:hypothetical protein [Bacteroidota bacterium]